MDAYMNKREFCEHLKLSRSTIQKFMREGIPYTKTSKCNLGRVRFNVARAIAWIEENKGVGY